MAKLLDETSLGQRPTPETAGGIARYRAEIQDLEAPGLAFAQAGAVVGSEADRLFQAYKVEQAKVDTLKAEDAYTQLRNKQLELTYGPGGFATKRGRNAVDLNFKEQSEAFEDLTRGIGETLVNDDQKRLFQQRAAVSAMEYKEGLLRHQFKERTAWGAEVTSSAVDGELANVAGIWSSDSIDPAKAELDTLSSVARIRGVVRAHADDRGLSEGEIAKETRALTDKVLTAKYLAWTSWNAEAAYADFKKNRNEISDPNHRLVLGNSLKERAAPVWVSQDGDAAMDKAAKEVNPPISQGTDTFTTVVGSLLKREGGYVAKDGKSGAPANFGINQRANPDIDVANLTAAKAKEIYRERYWNAIDGEKLAPGTALVGLDTAALQGPEVAKKLIEQTGGDPQAMIALRRQQLTALAAKDPEQAKYLQGWLKRLDGLQAEVAAMPGGGMVKVSMADKAQYPQTNQIPTARQVAAELPIALSQIKDLADKRFGKGSEGDPDRIAYEKQLDQFMRSKNAQRVQMVENQQRVALETVGNIAMGFTSDGMQTGGTQASGVQVTGGAGGNSALVRLTSLSQIMSNPQAAAAYQLLPFSGKQAVEQILKANANLSEHGDPALANELRNSITDGKIKWAEDLLNDPRVRAGNLNSTQLNFLRSQLKEAASEGGRSQMATVEDGIKYARAYFNDPNSVIKLSGKAPTAEYLFTLDAQKAVDAWRKDPKNAGKDVQELFDPRNKNSLVTEQNLRKYGMLSGAPATTAEALAIKANESKQAENAFAFADKNPMPSSIKTKEARDAWLSKLPPEATIFKANDGRYYPVPGRAPAAPTSAPASGSPEWIAQHEARRVPVGNFEQLDKEAGGQFGKGNIDLNNRQILVRPKGQGYSSLESMSFNQDGKEILIPTISDDGRQMSPKEAIAQYDKTGKHLGKFDTPEEANKYALQLERRQQAYYEAGPGRAILDKATKPAAKAKGDLPTFKPRGGMDAKDQANHIGGLWAAVKAVAGAALNTEAAGRAMVEGTSALVGWLQNAPKANREAGARGALKFLLGKDEFSDQDVPVIEAAVKYGNLDPGDLKKAKALLKAAGR